MQLDISRATPFLDPKSFPYGKISNALPEEEFAAVADKLVKTDTLLEAFAGEAVDIGAGAAADAALAAGAAALGPVAVAVAVLVILPLVIFHFLDESAEELQAEIQQEQQQHQQEVQKLQNDILKAKEDLANYDSMVELINRKSELQQRKRGGDKHRREEEEEERKKKRKSYFGCVERIECLERKEPLSKEPEVKAVQSLDMVETQPTSAAQPSTADTAPAISTLQANKSDVYGYEIRMSCAAQEDITEPGLLSLLRDDKTTFQDITKYGLDIWLCSCFVHEIPKGCDIGSSLSFEMNQNDLQVSKGNFPVKSGSIFEDGTSMIEIYSATLGWTREELVHTSHNAHGYDGMISGLTNGIDPKFEAVFDRLDGALERGENAIHYSLARLMEGSKPLVNKQIATKAMKQSASAMMLKGDNKIHYTAAEVSKLLQSKSKDPQATTLVVADIGQGACQLIANENGGLFISDFGYGRGPEDVMYRVNEMFEWDLRIPVVLSHWDRDHYGIALSYLARDALDKGRTDRVLPWKRTWIVPQLITGILARRLRDLIKNSGGTLVEFPLEESDVRWGNITISNCNAISTSKIDKNNNGALAFWYGNRSDGFTLYPGDANYEAIRIPKDAKDRINVLIATHHGSLRSIKSAGKGTGSTIPTAAKSPITTVYTGEKKSKFNKVDVGITMFSYGAGNSYNHSVDSVRDYYGFKDYRMLLATADLETGNVDDGVCYWLATTPSENSNLVAQIPPDATDDTERRFKITGKFSSTQLEPEQAAGTVVNNEQERQFDSEIALTSENLSNYRIQSEGKTLRYQIFATKIKITAPFRVNCDQDYPIAVILQCRDIEVQFSDSSNTLVTFDVQSGPDWEGPAEAGKEGRTGKAAFAGGYLDLRVAGDWLLKGKNSKELFSSINISNTSHCSVAIEYTNGQGGQGQQGGRGGKGADGVNGIDDTSRNVKGKRAGNGGMGSKGAKGGPGGEPSWIPASRILATKEKIKRPSAEVTFVHKKDAFGVSGKGGLGISPQYLPHDEVCADRRYVGGQGGPGGVGGLDGLRYNTDGSIDHQNSNRRQAPGLKGTSGLRGKDWEGNRNYADPIIQVKDNAIETQRLLLVPEYWIDRIRPK